jgi:hypothetical protein
MREDEDGLPMIGATSRYLGARPGVDIGVFNSGNVFSTRQGMSVSPMPPENLPSRRRPPEFDGTGKDPVFAIDTDDLPEELEYLPDPKKRATHGFIRPAYTMSFEHYQRALHETRELWWLV